MPRARKICAIRAGQGAPPEIAHCTVDTFASAKRGCSASIWYIVGTRNHWVTPSCSVISRYDCGSNVSMITTRPPTQSRGVANALTAAWKQGVAWITQCDALSPHAIAVLAAFASVWRYGIIAALGKPVLPPV